MSPWSLNSQIRVMQIGLLTRRGSWLILVVAMGCTPKAVDTAWTMPDFTGAGLPASADSNHADPRRTADTGGSGGDSNDTAASNFPSFDLVDGVFAYDNYYGTLFGLVELFTVSVTCHDAMTTYQDGVVYYVLPASDDSGNPAWIADYPTCGDAPCIYTGYWEQGSNYGYVSGDVTIDAYSDHYATVTYTNEIDADTLTFYNCGDANDWMY